MKIKNVLLLTLILFGTDTLVKTQPVTPFRDLAELRAEATRISNIQDKAAKSKHATNALHRLFATQPPLIGSLDTAQQLYSYISGSAASVLLGYAINTLEEVLELLEATRQAQRTLASFPAPEVAGPSEPHPITPPKPKMSAPSVAQINNMTLAQLKAITQTQINLMSEDQNMAYILKLSSLEQELQTREAAGPSEPRPITPPRTPSVPSIVQINAMTPTQLRSLTQTQINLMSEDQSFAYMLKLSSLEQEKKVQRTKEQDPIQHYYQGVLQVNDVHAVGPGVLQMLINNRCLFVYFKALSQTGVTCGYHAGLNAFALQQLFSQKKVINSKNIQAIVSKEYNDPEYQAFCKFGDRPHEMLSTDIYPYLFGENTPFVWDEAKKKFTGEIVKEIKGRHVTNAYVLGTKTDLIRLADSEDPSFENLLRVIEQMAVSDQLVLLKSVNTPSSIHQMFNNFKRPNYEGLAHFICNLNNAHWVLFSIIKTPGAPPVIIHLNSTNAPFDTSSSSYPYLKYLCNQLK